MPTTASASWPKPFVRTGWRALLCADLLQKLLLHQPPVRGAARRRRSGLRGIASPTSAAPSKQTPVEPGAQLQALRDSHGPRAATASASSTIRRDATLPLIGIVGEIFCRLNTFSNENLVQCLEGYGAEAWLSDIVEWIWYTNSEHFRKLKLEGRIWTAEALGAWVRQAGAEARRARPDGAVPRGFRAAAKSRTSTRSWSAPGPICRAKARSARWC